MRRDTSWGGAGGFACRLIVAEYRRKLPHFHPDSCASPDTSAGSHAGPDEMAEMIDSKERKPELRRTGERFWQDVSWDHYLRRLEQLQRTATYIEQNPVKAGLVCSAELWRWSSVGWQAKPPAPPEPQLS